MTTRRSLKAQNAWILNGAVLAHFLAFVAILSDPNEFDLSRSKSLLAPGAVSLALVVIAVLVLRGLVQGITRDRIIFWRWRAPLPGSRAFDHIAARDSRIRLSVIKKRYGSLPSEPNAQNAKFYKIYTDYKNEVPVLDAHKSYLATRDLAMITLFITITAPWAVLFITGDSWRAGLYAFTLASIFILLCLAAQSYGRRMVENTLAVASQ